MQYLERVSMAALAMALAAPPAVAGQAADVEMAEEIVVTGSRIARRDFDASSPVVTVGTELLQQTADFALETKLQQLPQFAASTSSQFAAIYTSYGASTLNLRNLGDNRNLVLLDGRRLQPSTSSLAIDINVIPAGLIENVEVITGGASAVYGSDAISGVINFRLRRNFEGLRIDAQQGITKYGDAPNSSISAMFGGNFAENRGNAVFSVEYANRGTFRQSDRAFYRDAYMSGVPAGSILGNGVYRPGANAPSQAALNAYFQQFGAPAGGVSRATDIGFNNDASSLFNVTGANIWNYTSLAPPRQAVSGISPTSKAVVEYPFVDQILSVPLERISAFGRMNYRITDHVELFAQAYLTDYTSHTEGGPSQMINFWQLSIPRDSAHPVPASLAALLDSRADPQAPWLLGKTYLFLGQRVMENKNQVYQILGGARGDLGLGDWSWEVYGSHGSSTLTQTGVNGFVLHSRVQTLMNAPNYGAGYSDASGRCTSGIYPFGGNGAPGERFPINAQPSALQQVSADCIAYISGNPVNRTALKQDVVEANFQGRLLSLPAGDVRLAVGAGWRRNSFSYAPDPVMTVARSSALDTEYSGQFATLGTEGEIAVKELYGEMLVPLLADKPFFHSLEASFAYRYSDYDQTGGVSAWKADLSWRPVETLLLRGGYQRAVRAPNVTELFQPPTPVLSVPQDLCQSNLTTPHSNTPSNPNRAKVQQLCRALMGAGAPPVTDPVNDPYGLNNYLGAGNISISTFVAGNPDLKPEKADTFTAGVVFRPRGELPLNAALTLTADYYNIRLDGAIAFVSAQQAYDFCFNANGSSNPGYEADNAYCQMIGRVQIPGSNGIPNVVRVTYQNQGTLRTDGIDLQGDLQFDAGPGRFGVNILANHLRSFRIQTAPGADALEYAGHSGGGFGQQGAYFSWKLFTNFTYSVGDAVLGLRWQHLSAVRNVAKVTAPASTLPDVPAYNLFDLFASVKVGEAMSLRGGVSNIANRQPPVTGAYPPTTDPYDYDIIGRRFYIGATVTF